MGQVALGKQRPGLFLFNIIITFAVASCSSSSHHAPVADVGQPPSYRIQEHVVAAGETLYSIAWRYNLDHRELARVNGIGRGYTIYPGQRLNLDTSRATTTARPPTAARSEAKSSHTATVRRTANKPVQKPSRSENQTRAAAAAPAAAGGANPRDWQWPLRGKILAPFESNGGLNKGIDISGKLGEPVLAAAGGKVVYSGSGLRGYGNLIIVKHNEKYLSAYAHNSRLLIEEGAVVRAGQKIAEVGASGTDTTKLHFEIRYDGKPVNPTKYLPRQ